MKFTDFVKKMPAEGYPAVSSLDLLGAVAAKLMTVPKYEWKVYLTEIFDLLDVSYDDEFLEQYVNDVDCLICGYAKEHMV